MYIEFVREKKKVNTNGAATIAQVASEENVVICEGMCGIKKCGKCKVVVTKGNDHNYTQTENELLSDDEKKSNVRLACCYVPVNDISVMTFETGKKKSKLQVVDDSYLSIVDMYAAVDCGTTTIEIYFCDTFGKVLLKASMDNPLRLFGNDVVSRISYASDDDRLMRMHNNMAQVIETIIGESGLKSRLRKLIFTGNTTMLHIALGKDIRPLGKYPFSTGYEGCEVVSPDKVGLKLDDNVTVYIPPVIAGHLGADAMCAYVCSMLINKRNEGGESPKDNDGDTKDNDSDIPEKCNKNVWLMMDVGTNSEMVLVADDDAYACSAAAGPAFESSMISCGMKNGYGAVKAVRYSDGNLIYDIEGVGDNIYDNDSKCNSIKGICASAVIDMVACLLEMGVIDSRGTMREEFKQEYTLSTYCHNIRFTQKDIRNVQMAKGAIMAGISVMCDVAGVNVSDIDNLYLTGNFGMNINYEYAKRVGLIPNVKIEAISCIENAAAMGAIRALVDDGLFLKMKDMAKKIRHIELTSEEDFSDRYVEMMDF